MVVRDPYERLFSGYIDKFFSPCSMPHEEVKVIRMFRANKTRTACRAGVNFTEFLQYVTNERSVNSHFKRQYQQCLPCHVDYDYIGKLETFQQDAEYILKEAAHMDPTEVFGASEQFEENSDLNIMYDVAERSFARCHLRNRCVSNYILLLRTWVTFQVSSPPPPSIPFLPSPLQPSPSLCLVASKMNIAVCVNTDLPQLDISPTILPNFKSLKLKHLLQSKSTLITFITHVKTSSDCQSRIKKNKVTSQTKGKPFPKRFSPSNKILRCLRC